MRTTLKNLCAVACAVMLLGALSGGCDDKGGSGGGGTATPKLATPKDAAMSFVQAMQNGDTAGIKSTTVNGTDDDYKNLASMGNAMKAIQSFKAEANAKFGPSAAELTGAIRVPFDDLSGREARINGDTARLVKPGEDGRPDDSDLQLKKSGDAWKVDLSLFPHKDDLPETAADMERLAKSLNEATVDIKSGKVKTIDELKKGSARR